ncbi:MAG: nucleotide sugar dehydrogenase [Candidatus Bathyarchaeia archaeon]
MKEGLIEKIRSKTASMAVLGLGNVGLATAAIFADVGFSVVGVDIDEAVAEAVAEGRSQIKELKGLVQEVVRKGRLKTSIDVLHAAREADIIVICVQTPLTKDKRPNLAFLEKACKSIADGPLRGKLVILVSTVPPGTTRSYIAPLLERDSGLKCGTDFWLAHCPERIALGKVIREFAENSRIIGGFGDESAIIAMELFKTVSKGEILVTDCSSSEVAKLAENTFRNVNIAFANELALICEQIGVDVMEAIRLANTHPRVNVHNPGCGVGGPCLPKDPYLLLSFVKKKRLKSKVIQPACELNDYMPEHTVELVVDALRKVGKDVENSSVAVLGVAFKGGVESVTNSPSVAIVSKLIGLGAKVCVYDPCSEESFGARTVEDVIEAVRGADCIVIATDHKMFGELELEKIRELTNDTPVLVDGRRVVNPHEANRQEFTYLGIGYGVE